MPRKVDNIELDDNNPEFNYAVDLVRSSGGIVYLTGKAGSGKTTFLKYIREASGKQTVVLAPTGVAALNAGGQTIHSFFRIAPSIYLPDDYRLRAEAKPDDDNQSTIFDNFKYRRPHKKLIKNMELLIIDEVSMVRCDLLDVVDRLLRVFREKEDKPFGGVQVLLIGDAFQLPPIAQGDHWNLLKTHYETPFFFSSKVLTEYKPKYIELKKIYRQKDQLFIDLLNKIRTNQVTDEDMQLLNSRFLPAIVKNENLNYVIIATHNNLVDATNKRKLLELETDEVRYEAEITGDFPDSMLPTDKFLNLKVGAQIMFIKNDAEKRFFNGKIAKIKKLEKDRIIVEQEVGSNIEVKRFIWHNIHYKWNEISKKIEETIMGEFCQFPVKLAWSVTVHKCQGLTFDNVIADIGQSFSPGQVYVALSRCTSLEGLVLKTKINRSAIKTDPNVIKFTELEDKYENDFQFILK
ncbi:MAG: AAA family ATPase [Candidatus Kapabacteria bacterium]|nr:AAA family ATPase [Ignavibacteriota bacterium]MCW5884283.1 AAA family ATPase [Candidatus Kapabacteria bacterium]